ncbi:aspartyl protease family protein [Sphingomonas sp. RT2P30]|uniref:aspartyl protease family protein n=1 Tax=Parasphingomonas halimpatiens TaxID=3096162 RepID=UPI002FC8D878
MAGTLPRKIILAATLALLPAPALAACSVAQIAAFKVTMNGLSPTIETRINGKDARFIVDSGAFYSFISPGSATELGLHLSAAPDGYYVSGVGGKAKIKIATVSEFGLAGASIKDIQFIVGGSEFGATGLLGQNVLGYADVEYDFAQGDVRLMRSKDCAHSHLAYWHGDKPWSTLETLPRTPLEPHTVAWVTLNGARIRALFDTGAPVTMLSLAAAARAGITPDSPGVVDAGESSGIGRRVVRTWIAPFASLKLGDDEQIQRIKLRIGRLEQGPIDMLIGADFFLSHRVYVDNRQNRMFITFNGGKVFDLSVQESAAATASVGTTPAAATGGPAPSDADGFARRAAALAARRQYAQAIADYGRAIALAPGDARYPLQRALARLGSGDHDAAGADLDLAVKLDPAAVDARIARAGYHARDDDHAPSRADADAADRVLAPSADRRYELADIYGAIDAFDAAVAQYDLWIRAHPDDSRRGETLNGRCWTRAEAGRELDKALDDCNAALRLRPGAADILDSRGLVQLRLGNLDRAIADYDAALARNPDMAWSHYGRGLAKQRKGLKDEGAADLAAAVKLDAKLPERARKLGVAP